MKKILVIWLFALVSGTVLFGQNDTGKQNQYLGILKLEDHYKTTTWTQNEINVAQAHFKRLMEFKEKGVVILAGRTQYENNHPDLTGLVIFYAPNLEEAQKFMKEDPAVLGKIMKSEVHPYQVALGCK